MNIEQITPVLLKDAQKNDYAGQDPFDGLNSSLFKLAPSLKNGLFGLVWIQLHKRLAINIRPLLGVPKMRNPKGIGLFILGLLEDYKSTGQNDHLKEAIKLADWLLTQQSDKSLWQHSCWGYHFDWNARAFFVPKGKPNVITTIYVAQALYALSEVTNESKYLDPAIDSAHFIVKTLYKECDGRHFFGYIPGESAFVHNASLWGAAWVAKVAVLTNNQHYKQLALNAARQSVSEQGADGSWVYGARHHHQFIDGFHTGYNLEALRLLSDELQIGEFESAIAKGLTYYKTHLFEQDGTARYYNNNRYPLDMHSVSQAVFTLLKVGKTPDDFTMAEKVINRAIQTLYMPKKQRFIYQKNKYFTNKVDYVRWTQAWVYYSFAYFNRQKMNSAKSAVLEQL
ncbi:aspartate-semialdehyde dehydrogenase [Pseudoalteromonas sp. APC 3218]|uniref:aspartate-semialdehyde dehydrogenase n=1 Tax=Pseudoalteromonas sp. APC 3218 TaxID=3035180 RepID=UPI0025B460CD|nr:aspartate-semialdehyde dehydrogenase [Pseudoalteromonas sp. APC 3218]MDN3404861.1 aspartate-semialdehyde dehydrogenase [Pseudoalteromonas sp. APC 3218]